VEEEARATLDISEPNKARQSKYDDDDILSFFHFSFVEEGISSKEKKKGSEGRNSKFFGKKKFFGFRSGWLLVGARS